MTKKELIKIIDVLPKNVRLTDYPKIIGMNIDDVLKTVGFKNYTVYHEYVDKYDNDLYEYLPIKILTVIIYNKDGNRLYYENDKDKEIEYFRYHKNIIGPKTFKIINEISFKQIMIENGKY